MSLITTVEGIMSTQMYVWNPDEQSKDQVISHAIKETYDTVPVKQNGQINGLLYISTGEIKPIRHDVLLSRDTLIPDALTILSSSHHPALLVLHGQQIDGILTPSDFNKVMARSYFYHLLAWYEMLISEKTRQFYTDQNEIIELIRPPEKTLAQYRKKVRERSKSAERNNLNLDLIHNLTLDELESAVLNDSVFCLSLGFKDINHAEHLVDGVNAGFRRKVMHPTRLMLSDDFGIDELNQYVHQVVELIDVLEGNS